MPRLFLPEAGSLPGPACYHRGPVLLLSHKDSWTDTHDLLLTDDLCRDPVCTYAYAEVLGEGEIRAEFSIWVGRDGLNRTLKSTPCPTLLPYT